MQLLLAVVLALNLRTADAFRVRVTQVLDARTMVVRDYVGREAIVVLDGVEVPPRYHRDAARKREALRAMVKYRLVTVVPRDRDERGRIVAQVLVGDTDVATALSR